MRILLLGGTGQVGAGVSHAVTFKAIDVVAPSRDGLDLQNPEAIAKVIASEPWDAVVNAAAYTEVDRAETEQRIAFAINAEAPAQLALETARHAIPLVHISTDYVFDGRKGAPYVEQDPTGPLNTYGRSKLAGERGVCTGNPRHVIVRTSWVYSPYRRNFVKTIVRLAAQREHLKVVADQRGCPTAAADVALACLEIAAYCAVEPAHAPYGTYHLTGAGEATWFEFASAIVAMTATRRGRSPDLVPISTSEYPTPAARAADTRLDCTAITRKFAITQRPWQQSLAQTIERLWTNEGAP